MDNLVHTLVLIVNVVAAFAVIVLVLLQHGKGADMGAAFGSGSAGSLFGSSGSANFLSRSTAVCATVFFVTCLVLVFVTSPSGKSSAGAMEGFKPAAAAPSASAPAQIPE